MFLATIMNKSTNEPINVMISSSAEMLSFASQIAENTTYELMSMVSMEFVTFKEFKMMRVY